MWNKTKEFLRELDKIIKLIKVEYLNPELNKKLNKKLKNK
jgi:hypothetical protein